MERVSICPCCGHKSTIYKHILSNITVSALVDLYKKYVQLKREGKEGWVRLSSDLNLTHTQINNFQKLKHFGVVQNLNNKWIITPLGIDFVLGYKKIPNFVLTRNNIPIPYSDELYNSFGEFKLVGIELFYNDFIPNLSKDEYQKMASLQTTIF